MAASRTVEKHGIIAALQNYVETRGRWPRLWHAITTLKDGAFSDNEKEFAKAKDLLWDAHLSKKQVDAYANLWAKAQDAKGQKSRSEIEKELYLDWAIWFDQLPTCEETDQRWQTGVAIERKIFLLEMEVAAVSYTHLTLPTIYPV